MEKVKHYTQLLLMAVLLATPLWGFGQESVTAKVSKTQLNDNTINGNIWTNLSGAKEEDTTYARSTIPASPGGPKPFTQYLKLQDFSAAFIGGIIPTNAIIRGIEVKFQVLSTTGFNVYDSSVRLIKLTGSPSTSSFVGNDKKKSTPWPFVGPRTYGGSNDLWGTTWTPADFKNSVFGVAIAARADTTGGMRGNPWVGHAEITVYFDPVDYYYDGTGAVTDLNNWDTDPSASIVGAHPSSFDESYVRFHLINPLTTTPDTIDLTNGSSWKITSDNSTLELGGIGMGNIVLIIQDGAEFEANVRVNNLGTLNSKVLGSQDFDLLNMRALGKLQFTGLGDQIIPNADADTLYNVTVGGSGIKTFEKFGEIIFKQPFTFTGSAKAQLNIGQTLVAPDNSSRFVGYGPNNYIITTSTSMLRQEVTKDSPAVIFPVGLTASYNPVTVAVGNSGITNYYEVRAMESVKNKYNGLGRPEGSDQLTKDVVGRSWAINRTLINGITTDNSSATTVKLQWNQSEETVGFNRDSAGVGFYLNSIPNYDNTGDTPVFNKGPITMASGSDPYTIVRSGLSDFDSTVYAIGDAQSPVPVELTAFTGVKIEDHVHLAWNTASENNNKGFVIQRTRDFKEWETLGFVNGNGTTVLPQTYGFDDMKPMSGINYYRLKQVDFDGKYAYSPVVAVDFAGSFVIDVFPNPAKGGTVNINLDNRDNEKLDVRLINIYGQEVLSQSTYQSNLKLNVIDVPNGNYILTVKAGNQVENRKISIIR